MSTETITVAIRAEKTQRVGWRGWAALIVLMLPVLLAVSYTHLRAHET